MANDARGFYLVAPKQIGVAGFYNCLAFAEPTAEAALTQMGNPVAEAQPGPTGYVVADLALTDDADYRVFSWQPVNLAAGTYVLGDQPADKPATIRISLLEG